jgi:YHS domain-containing protein
MRLTSKMPAMIRAIVALTGALFATVLFAQSPPVSLKGHDPVSYFTEGRPVKGQAGLHHDFDGARYVFASPKNRERFAASPERYTPQFSGLCTTGMALGVKAEADPSIFKIVDGKLYVFSSTAAREKVDTDPSLLAKAQQNSRSLR